MCSIRGLTVLCAALLQQTAVGQTHPEVLVVYNANSSDSLAVANHYMTSRNVPVANLCSIAPPANDKLSLSDYITYVKTPIQNCLNAVGQRSVLYIVMSYLTPYSVNAGPMGLASIDSYLADIWDKYASQPFLLVPNLPHPYYADSQSQGNVYAPFRSFATYRANSRNALIYSVWRIDGPTAAIASALVDQAIQAEANGGPSGQACIDEQRNVAAFPDSSYASGDWDLHKAAAFLQQAGVAVLEDVNPAEIGTPPAPATCPNTAFYSGWYSYNHYNDVFAWQTGSIGWHLDSYSAGSPRSGTSWVPNALARGIAVTTGSVYEPYLQGMVRPGGTFRNLLEGANVGDAFLRNTRWLKWEILYVGDPLYTPFGTGRYPFSPLQPVNSFQISPQEIVGGANSTGTITLSAPAPAGGTTFTLSAPVGIAVPASVTVAPGAAKANFAIATTISTTSKSSEITATSGSVSLENTIVTDPLLGGFVLSTGRTMAGFPVSVTAVLNGPAPPGGSGIALVSDNSAVSVPATVTVPAGLTAATFTAGSTPVSSAVTANITGTYAGARAGFSLAVVPGISSISASPSTIVAGGSTVIGVSLGTNVPAGSTATIQLASSDPTLLHVPATITAYAGTHYANCFATSTVGSSGHDVTITATYGGSTASVTVTIN